jgi:two-component system uhpT operon response regulator UhpA
MIRIVLADDHAIVRTGFRALIDEETDMGIIGECENADEARLVVRTQKPDVLALDISMPGGGLSLLPELRESAPALKLLVLSMHDREPYISEALRRGAHGYVTKGAATDELVAAVRAVYAGEGYVSYDIQRPQARPESRIGALSEREREVFLLLARGITPKQAASDLDVSIKTIYLHRSAIRDKLGVRNDLGLHRVALESGFVAGACDLAKRVALFQVRRTRASD